MGRQDCLSPDDAELSLPGARVALGTLPGLTRTVFSGLRRIARNAAGIEIVDGKEALLAARVARRVRALRLSACEEYLRLLERDTGGEVVAFLDAIATNVTSFFREPSHFALLAKTLRGWLAAGQRSFRFWSAATSSGQEAYSLAMTCSSVLGDEADYAILATDLSTVMLERARGALYPEGSLDGLTQQQRARYFRPHRGGDTCVYEVCPELRDRVVFGRLNLAQRPYPLRGPLDCVLCRNVLMYLTADARRGVVAEIERLLKPGGLLMTGHSETLIETKTRLRRLQPSVFMKEPSEARETM
jgi:chemotaxis protein methyltransferase CheR